MIDGHVHFRDWEQKDKETIEHGMRVGLMCGFDTFLDMPNTKPTLTTKENALKRIEDGKKVKEKLEKEGLSVNYSIFLGLTKSEDQIREMVELHSSLFPLVCGLKLFLSQSTGNMGITEESEQRRVFSLLASLNYSGVLTVHAEKESLFNRDEKSHSLSRPSISEIKSVEDQIENVINTSYKGKLHIAHISTKGAIELVTEAKKDGIKITCGATPHHALLTLNNESIFRTMNPPLRDKKDRDAVLDGLFNGTIDSAESDHAPHTLMDKLNGAKGIPGFEGMLRLIRFLRIEGMDEKRLEELFVTKALEIYNLPYKPMPVIKKITDEMIEKANKEYPYSAWN